MLRQITDMEEVIKTPAELLDEGFSLVEPNLVTYSPSYTQYLNLVTKLFNQTAALNHKFEARDYQLQAAAAYCCQRRNLACLSQGLGKTLITALVIGVIYPEFRGSVLSRPIVGQGGRVQIALSSSTAVQRWLADLAVVFPPGTVAYLSKVKDIQRATLAPIWVYTHDFLKLKANQKTRPTVSRWIGKRYRPAMLVVDEVHHLAQAGSARYGELDWLARRCKRFLGLSGTITEGQLTSLDNIMSLCYQAEWPYWRQPKQFSRLLGSDIKLQTDYKTGDHTPTDSKRLQTLDWGKLVEYYQLMRRYAHRVSIDEPGVRASITLPKVQIDRQVVAFSPTQQALYDAYLLVHKAELEFIAKQRTPTAAQKAKARHILYPLIRICNQADPTDITPKAAATLQAVAQAQKTVVFCQHVESARYITYLLQQSLGSEAVVRLYAQDDLADPKKLSKERRWRVIQDFESKSEIRAGVFSLNLAAEAIDLVSADQVLIYCQPWSATKLEQALARVVRPGNQHPVVKVTYITHQRGIDKYQLQLLDQKVQIANLMLDYDTGLAESAAEDELASLTQNLLAALEQGGLSGSELSL